MKKRWILLVTTVLLSSSIPIITCAQKRGEQVYAQSQKEIEQTKQDYLMQLAKGNISADLYLTIVPFLEIEQYTLTQENAQNREIQFPEDYVNRLHQYTEEEINKIAEIICRAKDYPEVVDRYIEEYNLDMRYIEKQLMVYGIEVELEISKEDFSILLKEEQEKG